ncbi:MAG TPA: hypothetical protein VMT14_12610 [Burkholderiaceae bacterium]|nr:hypothetical protein [Burkholderiaceae bacterium]
MASITVTGVPTVPTPRGAIWAARGAVAAWRLFSGLLTARRNAKQAARAALQTARDAAHVRALARLHAPTDPGFASDLNAAADRHEAASLR